MTEEESREYPSHRLFKVHIDVVPDVREVGNFTEAFGFQPPAEPLLQPAFEEGASSPLSEFVDRQIPDNIRIADPALLAGMKVKSLPDRDKGHKQVKDMADLFALLFYVADIGEVVERVRGHVSQDDLDRVGDSVSQDLIEQAAALLDVDRGTIEASVNRLIG